MSEDEKIKIRLKVGDVEFEYEGKSSIFKKELKEFLSEKGGLDKMRSLSNPILESSTGNQQSVNDQRNSSVGLGNSKLTTHLMSKYLNAKSAPELIMCVMAYRELALNQNKSSRSEIHNEMKTMRTYKKSMGNSLSTDFKRLLQNGKIYEAEKEKYSLDLDELNNIKNKISSAK